MVSAVPFDWQVTDSYFIVAHLHYVLVGGVVFPIFAALYYWIPKMTGRMLDERLGQIHFWLFFIGFNVTFFPMHIMGMLGMPRRVYTFHEGLGLDTLNMTSTVGAFIQGVAVLVFLWNFLKSMTEGEDAGNNPWSAGSLEWATQSPPEAYNFRNIPVVRSAEPLWDEEPDLSWDPSLAEPPAGEQRVVYETSVLDADTEELLTMPGDSPLPLLLALSIGLLFAGIILDQLVMVAAAAAAGLIIVAWWLYPEEPEAPPLSEGT